MARRDTPGSTDGHAAGTPRVVHTLHAWNDRTIAAITAVQAQEAARRGFEVTVIAASTGDGCPQIDPRVEVIDLGGSRARTFTSTPALARTLRRLRPDAVFAHGNGPARSTILATRGLGTRTTVVTIEHNHYSTFEWDHRAVRDLLNRTLLPRADLVVGVSPGIVDDLAATFPRLRGKLRMVPEPLTRWEAITAMANAPVDHPWFDDEVPIIVSVGHVHERKDQATLVRAFARLGEVRDGRPARLMIIGNAEGAYADSVRALARRRGVADRVDFLGRRENPLAFVARATAFVLSSRNEGMPVTLLEALACGTVAVSTDCPSGPRWLFETEERCGLLAPVGDDEALARQLAAALDDETLRTQLRTAGHARAARFSPARITDEQLSLVGLGAGRTGPSRSDDRL